MIQSNRIMKKCWFKGRVGYDVTRCGGARRHTPTTSISASREAEISSSAAKRFTAVTVTEAGRDSPSSARALSVSSLAGGAASQMRDLRDVLVFLHGAVLVHRIPPGTGNPAIACSSARVIIQPQMNPSPHQRRVRQAATAS